MKFGKARKTGEKRWLSDEEFEMARTFCMSLREELKKRINAGIYVRVVDNVLVVRIERFEKVFEFCEPYIFDKIMSGSSAAIMDVIIQAYRAWIDRLYFY